MGLAALPCISPLATTPIERISSLKSQNDGTFDFPESQYPLPDSPSGGISASRDDAETIDTVVPSPPLNDKASVVIMKPLVPAQSPTLGPIAMISHSMDLGLEDEINKDVILRPESTGLSSNPEVLHIQTLTGKLLLSPWAADKTYTYLEDDNAPDSRHDTAEKLVSSSPSPESAPTTAAELAKQEVSGQIPGHRALHCRLCQIDTCSDPTATMCGHMFCYKYVSFVSSHSNRGFTCSLPDV